MLPETKQDLQEDTTATEEVESPEKGTGTDQTSTEKTFTQADVNRLIAKEKASWKRSADREKETLTEAEKSLRDQLTARDELIQSQVDVLKKDLELTPTEKLLMDKLADDPLEQFKTLTEIIEAKSKADGNIPRTPQGKKKQPEFQSNFNAGM